MKKQRKYGNTFFAVDVIERGRQQIESLGLDITKAIHKRFAVTLENAEWLYDSKEEFYSGYRTQPSYAQVRITTGHFEFEVTWQLGATVVGVRAPDRENVESVFRIFEDAAPTSKVVPGVRPKPVVFIGHGGGSQWRDLKDHLHEKHGYYVEAYEIGARAGHTIRDILEGMLRRSTFALLVLTAEDHHKDGTAHARENVIHELGLFQGRLGFSRAIILLEDGTSEFSNIKGIHQIRFAANNIKEAYGDVLATLKREIDDGDI